MEQDTNLPERFTEGVWYDSMSACCCRIVETEESVGLVEPDREGSDPYYTFDEDGLSFEDAVDKLHSGFRQVPEDAVENPARYLSRILDNVQHDQYGRTGGPTLEEQTGISYARQQVRIEETE